MTIHLLQEFSVPLMFGAFVSLIFANVNRDLHHSIRTPLSGIGSAFQGDAGEQEEATDDEESRMELPPAGK